ncbi:hypothetical protein VA599_19875 [Chromobacterium sp. TRC.1.1.SA]|uniref:RHS repeat protein n=1 Tax=Chromobacterium indicum TaxID=3110228 RepID=A0ABV0CQ06_9NEIS
MAYDKAGIADNHNGQLNYRYDLLEAATPKGVESFRFDPAGNLLDNAPAADGHQNDSLLGNLLSQYAGRHYRYDSRGNLVEKRVASPSWNGTATTACPASPRQTANAPTRWAAASPRSARVRLRCTAGTVTCWPSKPATKKRCITCSSRTASCRWPRCTPTPSAASKCLPGAKSV